MVALVVLVVFLVVVAGILTAAARRPDRMQVSRATTMVAPPDRVIALIDDFHQWASWSPFEKLDPQMTKTFAGAERGVGARYAWSGNKKAGQGSMAVTAVEPTRVALDLEFIKPFPGRNQLMFDVVPTGSGSRVTWTMDGPTPFLHKVIGLFVNFERMIGRDFDEGLAKMKRVAEAPPAA